MKTARYSELQRTDAKLTEAELAEGWFYCSCEWDGMLINKAGREAEICHCFGPNGTFAASRTQT